MTNIKDECLLERKYLGPIKTKLYRQFVDYFEETIQKMDKKEI